MGKKRYIICKNTNGEEGVYSRVYNNLGELHMQKDNDGHYLPNILLKF